MRKGLFPEQENNGGTMAHPDIALDFQLWLYPEKRYEVVKAISREMTRNEERRKKGKRTDIR